MLSRIPLSRLSFRWQITLLGALSVILFLAVLVATFSALRYTKSSVLDDEKKHLSDAANALAREYADRAQPAPHNEVQSPVNFALGPSDEILTLLTRAVLRTADGVEGGFYSTTENTLVGYSFPTRYGTPDPSDKADLPADTRPAILQVAHNAALTHKLSEQVLTGVNEIILIEAVPVRQREYLCRERMDHETTVKPSRFEPISNLSDCRRTGNLGLILCRSDFASCP